MTSLLEYLEDKQRFPIEVQAIVLASVRFAVDASKNAYQNGGVPNEDEIADMIEHDFTSFVSAEMVADILRMTGVLNERDMSAEREAERNRVAFKRETVYQDQPAQPPGAFTPINHLGLTATQIERRERKPPPKREADYWDALADQEATDAWLAARDGGDE